MNLIEVFKRWDQCLKHSIPLTTSYLPENRMTCIKAKCLLMLKIRYYALRNNIIKKDKIENIMNNNRNKTNNTYTHTYVKIHTYYVCLCINLAMSISIPNFNINNCLVSSFN